MSKAVMLSVRPKWCENYIYKVGVVYGNVIEAEKPVEFYFETQERKAVDDG